MTQSVKYRQVDRSRRRWSDTQWPVRRVRRLDGENGYSAMRLQRRVKIGVLWMLVVANGCVKSGPQVAPVRGRLTLEGRPLENADVTFQPDGAQRSSIGRTDPDGRYELAYKRGQPGAIVGPHTVRIAVSSELVRKPPKIAAEFDTRSKLRAMVEAGKQNVFDFDVKTERK
jgi:hypothetical protein